jgi:uroporphyrinogen decarboxylase
VRTHDSLFMRAARGETTERPPIWLMRQAGRSDPVYREIREAFARPLEDLFRSPELACMITLLPVRWGVDAAIIFQDILTPLYGMGAPFVFRPGPQPETPFKELADFDRLHLFDMAEGLPSLGRLYEMLCNALRDTDVPLLGFAGAPFTLFAFMAENGSPPSDLPQTRALMTQHPRETRSILELLANMTVDYLKFHISCGADAVQLFESVGNLLSPDEYAEWMLPYQQQVFDGLRETGKPTIFFARRHDTLIPAAMLQAAGATILSLPQGYSIKAVRAALGADVVIQGNLDNHLLADGDEEAILAATAACIEEGGCRGHIFNLSHGLLPHTPFENVRLLVETVRGYGKGT